MGSIYESQNFYGTTPLERHRLKREIVPGLLLLAFFIPSFGICLNMNAMSERETYWSFKTEGIITTTPVLSNGFIYIFSEDYRLHAVNATSGTALWVTMVPGKPSCNPRVAGGNVVICIDHILYSFDARTGERRWSRALDGFVTFSSPAVDGTTLFIESSDNRLQAIDGRTGIEVWGHDIGYVVGSSPTIDNGTVYIGTAGGSVKALDTRTGREILNVSTGAPVRRPVVWTNILIAGTTVGDLVALNITDGAMIWYRARNGTVSTGPVVVNGTVFYGIEDIVYAIDARTGLTLWEQRVRFLANADPVLSQRNLFVATFDGRVVSLDLRSGRMTWTFRTSGTILSSPIVSDDKLYVASYDGTLYAFSVRQARFPVEPSIMSSAQADEWPMEGHDLGRTGFSEGGPGAVLERAWASVLNSPITTAPVVADNLVFLGTSDGMVHALDIGSGEERWLFRTDSSRLTSPAIANGTAFVVTSSYTLALETAQGRPLWNASISGDTPAAVAYGFVFSSGRDGLFALDAATGEHVWTSRVCGSARSNLIIVDKTVRFVTTNGNVCSIDARTGELLWRKAHLGSVLQSASLSKSSIFIVSGDPLFALSLPTGERLWSIRLNQSRDVSPAVVVDDMAYIGTDKGLLIALNISTGLPVWRYESAQVLILPPVGANDTIFVTGSDGRVSILDMRTGKRLGRLQLNDTRPLPFAIANRSLFIATRQGRVYSFRQGHEVQRTPRLGMDTSGRWGMQGSDIARTGVFEGGPGAHLELAWRARIFGQSTTPPVIVDDTIYCGSTRGWLYAFDANTGEERWRIGSRDDSRVMPTIANRTVYFISENRTRWGTVHAIDAATGSEVWRTGLQVPSRTPPVSAHGLIYVASRKGDIFALSEVDGMPVWSRQDFQGGLTGFTISNATLFFGTYTGDVLALDALTGETRWRGGTQGSVRAPPSAAEGIVYIGTVDGNVYAFDESSGERLWYREGDRGVDGSFAVGNGTLFIGSRDGRLVAVDARSGIGLWAFLTGGLSMASPAISEGVIYIGTPDGLLYVVDAVSGSRRGRYRIASGITSSPVIAEGMVYVTSTDGSLYAFRASQPDEVDNDTIFKLVLISLMVAFLTVTALRKLGLLFTRTYLPIVSRSFLRIAGSVISVRDMLTMRIIMRYVLLGSIAGAVGIPLCTLRGELLGWTMVDTFSPPHFGTMLIRFATFFGVVGRSLGLMVGFAIMGIVLAYGTNRRSGPFLYWLVGIAAGALGLALAMETGAGISARSWRYVHYTYNVLLISGTAMGIGLGMVTGRLSSVPRTAFAGLVGAILGLVLGIFAGGLIGCATCASYGGTVQILGTGIVIGTIVGPLLPHRPAPSLPLFFTLLGALLLTSFLSHGTLVGIASMYALIMVSYILGLEGPPNDVMALFRTMMAGLVLGSFLVMFFPVGVFFLFSFVYALVWLFFYERADGEQELNFVTHMLVGGLGGIGGISVTYLPARLSVLVTGTSILPVGIGILLGLIVGKALGRRILGIVGIMLFALMVGLTLGLPVSVITARSVEQMAWTGIDPGIVTHRTLAVTLSVWGGVLGAALGIAVALNEIECPAERAQPPSLWRVVKHTLDTVLEYMWVVISFIPLAIHTGTSVLLDATRWVPIMVTRCLYPLLDMISFLVPEGVEMEELEHNLLVGATACSLAVTILWFTDVVTSRLGSTFIPLIFMTCAIRLTSIRVPRLWRNILFVMGGFFLGTSLVSLLTGSSAYSDGAFFTYVVIAILVALSIAVSTYLNQWDDLTRTCRERCRATSERGPAVVAWHETVLHYLGMPLHPTFFLLPGDIPIHPGILVRCVAAGALSGTLAVIVTFLLGINVGLAVFGGLLIATIRHSIGKRSIVALDVCVVGGFLAWALGGLDGTFVGILTFGYAIVAVSERRPARVRNLVFSTLGCIYGGCAAVGVIGIVSHFFGEGPAVIAGLMIWASFIGISLAVSTYCNSTEQMTWIIEHGHDRSTIPVCPYDSRYRIHVSNFLPWSVPVRFPAVERKLFYGTLAGIAGIVTGELLGLGVGLTVFGGLLGHLLGYLPTYLSIASLAIGGTGALMALMLGGAPGTVIGLVVLGYGFANMTDRESAFFRNIAFLSVGLLLTLLFIDGVPDMRERMLLAASIGMSLGLSSYFNDVIAGKDPNTVPGWGRYLPHPFTLLAPLVMELQGWLLQRYLLFSGLFWVFGVVAGMGFGPSVGMVVFTGLGGLSIGILTWAIIVGLSQGLTIDFTDQRTPVQLVSVSGRTFAVEDVSKTVHSPRPSVFEAAGEPFWVAGTGIALEHYLLLSMMAGVVGIVIGLPVAWLLGGVKGQVIALSFVSYFLWDLLNDSHPLWRNIVFPLWGTVLGMNIARTIAFMTGVQSFGVVMISVAAVAGLGIGLSTYFNGIEAADKGCPLAFGYTTPYSGLGRRQSLIQTEYSIPLGSVMRPVPDY